jgi:hypothetical protein
VVRLWLYLIVQNTQIETDIFDSPASPTSHSQSLSYPSSLWSDLPDLEDVSDSEDEDDSDEGDDACDADIQGNIDITDDDYAFGTNARPQDYETGFDFHGVDPISGLPASVTIEEDFDAAVYEAGEKLYVYDWNYY